MSEAEPAARAEVVPTWAPRLTEGLVYLWCAGYVAWGAMKIFHAFAPTNDADEPPIAGLAPVMGGIEIVLGILTAMPRKRAVAALAAFAVNVGLVGFAFVADARGLPWRGCGCFFEGIDLPWLPWHALFAGVVAVPFFSIFLDAERRGAGR